MNGEQDLSSAPYDPALIRQFQEEERVSPGSLSLGKRAYLNKQGGSMNTKELLDSALEDINEAEIYLPELVEPAQHERRIMIAQTKALIAIGRILGIDMGIRNCQKR